MLDCLLDIVIFKQFFYNDEFFFFEIDKLNVKSFYFEFDDDLKCLITFSMFLLNSLMKILNENLFITQFNDYNNI